MVKIWFKGYNVTTKLQGHLTQTERNGEVPVWQLFIILF